MFYLLFFVVVLSIYNITCLPVFTIDLSSYLIIIKFHLINRLVIRFFFISKDVYDTVCTLYMSSNENIHT